MSLRLIDEYVGVIMEDWSVVVIVKRPDARNEHRQCHLSGMFE